jgi:hypothetical protein
MNPTVAKFFVYIGWFIPGSSHRYSKAVLFQLRKLKAAERLCKKLLKEGRDLTKEENDILEDLLFETKNFEHDFRRY